MADQKSSWRGFTWEKFSFHSLFLFITTLLVTFAWNYFDKEENIANAFSQKEIVKRLILSFLIGFVITVWHEPRMNDSKYNEFEK